MTKNHIAQTCVVAIARLVVLVLPASSLCFPTAAVSVLRKTKVMMMTRMQT